MSLQTGTNTALDAAYGGSGNDVIVGLPGFADVFNGESGNDIIMPPALRADPLGNIGQGGSGYDVVILANGMMDSYTLESSLSIPVGDGCKVKAAWDDNPDDDADEPTEFAHLLTRGLRTGLIRLGCESFLRLAAATAATRTHNVAPRTRL